MKNIYLIRHGQSLGNADESVYSEVPDWKIPLTELGIQQAKEVGSKLNDMLDGEIVMYYSPMKRASQTHGIILDLLGDKVVYDKEEPLVSEQSFGMPNSYSKMFTNNDMMEYRDWYGAFYYTPPDGESSLDVLLRAKRFLYELECRGYERNIVIISHGAFIKVLLMELLGWSVEKFDRTRRPDNCQIVHVENKRCVFNAGYKDWVLKTPLQRRTKTLTDRN